MRYMRYRVIECVDSTGKPINYELQVWFWLFWSTIASYGKLEFALETIKRMKGSKRVVFSD